MKENYIKSPLNYIGGKYKILKYIIPLFPDNINTFVDLFGGGFNVGINVDADHIVYNDSCKQVVELMKYFKGRSAQDIDIEISSIINEYGLSNSDKNGYTYYDCNSSDGLTKYNKEKYINLRASYNTSKDVAKLFTIIMYSFSNQIRFNSKNEFNMPCGKRDYNKSLQNKLAIFCNRIHEINCDFMHNSFEHFNFSNFTKNDFVYCDPPYFNSIAAYNEQDGWTEENEKSLLNILDNLNNKCVKFALSNNLKYDNPILDRWKENYKVHYIDGNYSNCNYHKIDRSKDIEVLITNY